MLYPLSYESGHWREGLDAPFVSVPWSVRDA